MPFVIDPSVVSGWYLEDQATAYTGHVAARLAEERACAPALWELELTNEAPAPLTHVAQSAHLGRPFMVVLGIGLQRDAEKRRIHQRMCLRIIDHRGLLGILNWTQDRTVSASERGERIWTPLILVRSAAAVLAITGDERIAAQADRSGQHRSVFGRQPLQLDRVGCARQGRRDLQMSVTAGHNSRKQRLRVLPR